MHHRMDLGRDVEESNQPKQPNSWIGLVQHFIAPQEKARPRVRSGHCFAFELSWKSTLAPTSKIYELRILCLYLKGPRTCEGHFGRALIAFGPLAQE